MFAQRLWLGSILFLSLSARAQAPGSVPASAPGSAAGEEALNAGLVKTAPSGIVLGAVYGVPENAKAAPEPPVAAPVESPVPDAVLPDATGSAPATTAPPVPALPAPVPAELLAQYRIPVPGMTAPFLRPAGAANDSLFWFDIDWSSPDSAPLLAPEVSPALEQFLRLVVAGVRGGGAALRVVITPPPAADLASAVFIKRISSAVRGERRDAKFGLLLPAGKEIATVRPLYAFDLAPYIDLWLARAETVTAESAKALQTAGQELDLTAELGITFLPLRAQKSAAPMAAGLAAGFHLFISEPLPAGAKYFPALRKLLPVTALGVELEGRGAAYIQGDPDDGKKIDGLVLGKLYDDKTDTEYLLIFAPEVDPKQIIRLVLPTADVKEATLWVPLHDANFPLELAARDERSDTASVLAYARGEPFLISYKRLELQRLKGQQAREDHAGKRETVAVKAKYTIPVEEVIKRYQAWQTAQDFRLDTYTAKATVHYLWGVGAGAGSINVTFVNNFFYARKGGATWEQTQMLVEGLPWTGRDIPELPIPQPEKVNTVPLDISFGKQYAYTLTGEDVVSGHKAWKVRFKPLDSAQALYDGHFWVDEESGARLKVSAVQTGLKPPMLTSDETTEYAPMPAPDGGQLWVMRKISGQQTFSAAGFTLKAQRTVEFENLALNPPDYAARLAQAEAGDNHMLKETSQGLRYFEKNADGSRAPRAARSRRYLIGGALFHDPSIDAAGSSVVGGIAVDIVDTDFLHRDWQFNAALVGVFNNVTIADPHLFGSHTTLTASASLLLLKQTDRFYVAGVESRLEQVKGREQSLVLALSHPIGNFFNGRIGVSAENQQYFGVTPKLNGGVLTGTGAGFITPVNPLLINLYGQLDFNRRGWGMAVEGESVARSRWRAWGTPVQQAAFNPDTKNYLTWNLQLGKAFPLPKYQRITTELSWLDGRNLDRFSAYHFSIAGQRRLPGFSGSGVRFDQGWLAKTSYGFTLGSAVRVGADLGWARVRTRPQGSGALLIPGEDWTSHGGIGLSANLITHKRYIKFLPQNSLVRFEIGYAAHSDYKPVQGNLTYTIAILKLLK